MQTQPGVVDHDYKVGCQSVHYTCIMFAHIYGCLFEHAWQWDTYYQTHFDSFALQLYIQCCWESSQKLYLVGACYGISRLATVSRILPNILIKFGQDTIICSRVVQLCLGYKLMIIVVLFISAFCLFVLLIIMIQSINYTLFAWHCFTVIVREQPWTKHESCKATSNCCLGVAFFSYCVLHRCVYHYKLHHIVDIIR